MRFSLFAILKESFPFIFSSEITETAMTDLFIAGVNLVFDLMKQLVTVDAALIAFFGTLLGLVYKNRKFTKSEKWLALLFSISLFVSIIFSLLFLSIFSRAVMYRTILDANKWPSGSLEFTYLFSIGSFVLAILLLLIFIFINLSNPPTQQKEKVDEE